jgi:hypothetical protein
MPCKVTYCHVHEMQPYRRRKQAEESHGSFGDPIVNGFVGCSLGWFAAQCMYGTFVAATGG